MKVIKVQVSYTYELKVDTESSYVKDYDSEQGLIEDLASYHFTTLPVIGRGVEIKDIELDSYEIID